MLSKLINYLINSSFALSCFYLYRQLILHHFLPSLSLQNLHHLDLYHSNSQPHHLQYPSHVLHFYFCHFVSIYFCLTFMLIFIHPLFYLFYFYVVFILVLNRLIINLQIRLIHHLQVHQNLNYLHLRYDFHHLL